MVQQRLLTFCRVRLLKQSLRLHKQLPRLIWTNSTRKSEEKEDSFDKYNFKNDPLVKSLLKDLRKDFSAEEKELKSKKEEEDSLKSTSISLTERYETFVDSKAQVIYDMIEEEQRYQYPEEEEAEDEELKGINLKHGISGVFDIEDLYDILSKENTVDLAVYKPALSGNVAGYQIICCTKSTRHTISLAGFIKKIYKKKKYKSDPHCFVHMENIPTTKKLRKLRLRGREWQVPKDWAIVNVGNVVVHLMSRECRQLYDLDHLYAVGFAFDDKARENDDDPTEKLLKEHTYSAQDFESLLR